MGFKKMNFAFSSIEIIKKGRISNQDNVF